MEKLNSISQSAHVFGKIGNFNTIGDETYIDDNAVIGNCCNIGDCVKIGKNVIIGNNVSIGNGICILPDSIIGNNVTIKEGVILGKNNIIHDNCVLRGNTIIGDNNEFLPGCIIGFWPKDIADHHYEGKLIIGNDNFFGENTIINVGEDSRFGNETKIGNKVYSMDKVTINHNDRIAVGNPIPDSQRAFMTIISSGVSLAGHVEVEKGANLGMQAVVHQFCGIGAGAMIGMNANVTKNVPPFAEVIGNKVVDYNRRPLVENLGFDTYEEEYLELVGDMIKTACKAGEPQEALDKLQKYKGCGYWYDKAQAVIASFIKNIQNGRELMKFEK